MVAEEEPVSPAALDRLTEAVIAYVDLDGIKALSASAGPYSALPVGETPKGEHGLAPARIAVASDRAFCFYYQDNIDLIREAGAEYFSSAPLAATVCPLTSTRSISAAGTRSSTRGCFRRTLPCGERSGNGRLPAGRFTPSAAD